MKELAVGDVAKVSRTFTQSDVDEFARVTGDVNPLHIDEEAAARGRFGATRAHQVWTGVEL